MKSKIALILLVIFLFGLVGCESATTIEETNKDESSMFVLVEKTGGWYVVYHKDTKVMYAISNGYYNGGTFTMLMNADGTPQVWEGE